MNQPTVIEIAELVSALQGTEYHKIARELAYHHDRLQTENARLRTALHDAINRPLGVVPDSALEFYEAAGTLQSEKFIGPPIKWFCDICGRYRDINVSVCPQCEQRKRSE